MLNFMMGTVVMTLIQTSWPKGLAGFHETGGDMLLIPAGAGEVVLYNPENNEDAKQKILTRIQQLGFNARFVDSIGPSPTSEEEVQEIADRLLGTLSDTMQGLDPEGSEPLSISINRIAATITVLSNDPKKIAKKLAKALSDLDEIPRVCIIKGESVEWLEGEYTFLPQVKIVADRPQREKIISQDDILNLKIALETGDIDEIIRNM
ncbi:MAG: hypothetical protein D4S01_02990 [Dehalococcoidia bacterium]|nr:MAG: hypothetical protein D4S01_02990 [Dehalococcoidia bacterium]